MNFSAYLSTLYKYLLVVIKIKPVFYLQNFADNDYIMHCPNRESAEIFCSFLHENGMNWSDGSTYEADAKWEDYGWYTGYNFNNGYYGDIDDYNDDEYPVLEFYDFDWDEFINEPLAESSEDITEFLSTFDRREA